MGARHVWLPTPAIPAGSLQCFSCLRIDRRAVRVEEGRRKSAPTKTLATYIAPRASPLYTCVPTSVQSDARPDLRQFRSLVRGCARASDSLWAGIFWGEPVLLPTTPFHDAWRISWR